jgi:MFS family permease
MLVVLRSRNFFLLWLGQLVSLAGDWVLFVALPFFIFQLTGSILQTGLMFIVQAIPRIVLGSVAGVFVDRWNRRWTMIASDLSRAALLLLLLLVHSISLLWLIYVVSFVQTTIAQFFEPASNAFIPSLVEEERLVEANSLASFNDAVTRLIGPPLGGALFALVGLASVVWIDSATFVFSALMVLLIRLPRKIAQQDTEKEAKRVDRHLWREWLEGVRLIGRSRIVGGVFLAVGITMIEQGMLNVLLVPFVKNVMHGSSVVFGTLITAQGIGSLIGTVLIGRVAKLVKPAYLISGALFIFSIVTFIIFNVPVVPVALLLIAFAGLFVVGLFVSMQTLLQSYVADSHRGRVFGAFTTMTSLMMLLGMGISTLFGTPANIIFVLDTSCVLPVVAAIMGLVMLDKARLVKDEKVMRV